TNLMVVHARRSRNSESRSIPKPCASACQNRQTPRDTGCLSRDVCRRRRRFVAAILGSALFDACVPSSVSVLRDIAMAAGAAPVFCLLGAFLVTFLLTREVTSLIHAHRGAFGDIVIGDHHLHHMIWGVGLVLVSGTTEFAFTPSKPWNVLPALLF